MATKKKAEVQVNQSKADEIWENIKDIDLNLYALENQTVEKHAKRIPIPGDTLYLKSNTPAFVAALGEAQLSKKVKLSDKYDVGVTDGGFITVSYNIDHILSSQEDEEYIKFPRPDGKVDKILKKDF